MGVGNEKTMGCGASTQPLPDDSERLSQLGFSDPAQNALALDAADGDFRSAVHALMQQRAVSTAESSEGVDHEPVWVNDAWSCAGISQNRARSCQKDSLEPEEALSRLGSSLGTGNSEASEASCTSSEELTGTKGSGYRGCQQKTRGGFTCQDWSLQSPHKHSNTPSAKPGKGLEGAYCRNPSNSATIYCYTTSDKKRWEYCNPGFSVKTARSAGVLVGVAGRELIIPKSSGPTIWTNSGEMTRALPKRQPNQPEWWRKNNEQIFPAGKDKDDSSCFPIVPAQTESGSLVFNSCRSCVHVGTSEAVKAANKKYRFQRDDQGYTAGNRPVDMNGCARCPTDQTPTLHRADSSFYKNEYYFGRVSCKGQPREGAVVTTCYPYYTSALTLPAPLPANITGPTTCMSNGIVRTIVGFGTKTENRYWTIGCRFWKHVYCANIVNENQKGITKSCVVIKRINFLYADS